MVGIMDAFRGAIGLGSANPAEDQRRAAEGMRTEPTISPHVNNNPTVPNDKTPQSDGSNPAIPAAGKGEESPLANYKDLYTKKEGAPTTPTAVPQFNLDVGKLAEHTKGMDFTKSMDPEMVTKAMSGDTTAFANVLNAAVQQGFQQSTVLTANLVQQALTSQANKYETSVIPELMRKFTTEAGIREKAPTLANPAVAPLVRQAEEQFRQQYPQASAQEITDYTTKYMTDISKSILESQGLQVTAAPDQATLRKQAQQAGDGDWSIFFSQPS